MHKKAVKTYLKELDNEMPMFPASTVAGILDISVKELKKYVNEGILTPVQKSSKRVLYCLNDIETAKFINYLSHDLCINFTGIKIIFYMLKETNIAPSKYRDYIDKIIQGQQGRETEGKPLPEIEAGGEQEEISSDGTEQESLTKRLEAHIREKLEVFNLTKSQINKVIPELIRGSRYLYKNKEINLNSRFFDFEEKINRVVSIFEKQGLTKEIYLKAAVRNPRALIYKRCGVEAIFKVWSELEKTEKNWKGIGNDNFFANCLYPLTGL